MSTLANGRRFSSLIAIEGRFSKRNVCDSATEIPYGWRKSTLWVVPHLSSGIVEQSRVKIIPREKGETRCRLFSSGMIFTCGRVLPALLSLRKNGDYSWSNVNQCFHDKSGSHGVPNANLFNFTFLQVDFGKVLCSSANELQQNSNASSREDYIPQILTVLLEILRVYIWPLWPFVFCLSFVNNS